jgi:hypothetical protein
VFIGQEALFPPEWFEDAYYQMDWDIDGHHLGYISLDLHGKHSPMVHHYMFKETHTISNVQQANHEWREGNEEETTYTQATESLKVVFNDIQHGLKVLQRFKITRQPLVKILSNFENTENHGESIELVFHYLITWTLAKEGITLLKLFGDIGTSLEALL